MCQEPWSVPWIREGLLYHLTWYKWWELDNEVVRMECHCVMRFNTHHYYWLLVSCLNVVVSLVNISTGQDIVNWRRKFDGPCRGWNCGSIKIWKGRYVSTAWEVHACDLYKYIECDGTLCYTVCILHCVLQLSEIIKTSFKKLFDWVFKISILRTIPLKHTSILKKVDSVLLSLAHWERLLYWSMLL